MTDAEKIIKRNFGKVVTVTNPNPDRNASWTGRLIGYRDHPSVSLEFDNGERMSLPAAWVVDPDA